MSGLGLKSMKGLVILKPQNYTIHRAPKEICQLLGIPFPQSIEVDRSLVAVRPNYDYRFWDCISTGSVIT